MRARCCGAPQPVLLLIGALSLIKLNSLTHRFSQWTFGKMHGLCSDTSIKKEPINCLLLPTGIQQNLQSDAETLAHIIAAACCGSL